MGCTPTTALRQEINIRTYTAIAFGFLFVPLSSALSNFVNAFPQYLLAPGFRSFSPDLEASVSTHLVLSWVNNERYV